MTDMPAFAGDAAASGAGGGGKSKGGQQPNYMQSGTGLLGQPTSQGGMGLDPSQMTPPTPPTDTSNAAAAGPPPGQGFGGGNVTGGAAPGEAATFPISPPAPPTSVQDPTGAQAAAVAGGPPPPTTAAAATPGGSPQAIGAFPPPTQGAATSPAPRGGYGPQNPPGPMDGNLSPTLSQLSQITQTGLQPQSAQPTRQAYPESGYDPQAGFPDTGQPPATAADTTATAAPPAGETPQDLADRYYQGDTTTPTPPFTTDPGQPPPSEASPEPTVTSAAAPGAETPPASSPPTAGAAPTGGPGGRTPETETPPIPSPPRLAAPTGPAQAAPGTTAGGTPAPAAQPADAQGANPLGILGDIIRAFLDPLGMSGGGGIGGLISNLGMESPGNPPGLPPWAPGYGPQSRVAPGTQPPRPGTTGTPGTPGTPGTSGAPPTTTGAPPGTLDTTKTPPYQGPGLPKEQQQANQAAQGGDNGNYIQGLGGHSTIGGRQSNDMSRLNPEFGRRLADAGRAYKQETGQDPKYGEGYRDAATQQIYWNRLQGGRLGPVARPGQSLHQQGLAMDMPDSGFTRWLQQGNAQRFGLGFPVRNDSNHIQMQHGNTPYPYTPTPEGSPAAQTGVSPNAANTNLSGNLVNRMQQFEGFSARAYPDGSQYSIGYGTRATSPNEVIDQNTAQQRLSSELNEAQGQVQQQFPNLPEGVRDGLTSLTYNTGPGWMRGPIGQAIRNGDYDTAGRLIQQYHVSQPGHVTRRAWEAQQVRGGLQRGASAADFLQNQGFAMYG